MEREVCRLQNSPLMHEKKYVEMVRFIRDRCNSDATVQLPTRVASAHKTLSPEEAFTSSVVSHLLQLQLILDKDRRKDDLYRVHKWFTANKVLLFPTTKTYQKQAPKMKMGVSTPPSDQTTPAQTGDIVQPADTTTTIATATATTTSTATATTTTTTTTAAAATATKAPAQLLASDVAEEESNDDSDEIDHSLDHHPRWENTDFSSLTAVAFKDSAVLLSEDVGWDLVEEKEARKEWKIGRSDLWELAKKFYSIDTGKVEEPGGRVMDPVHKSSILEWVQATAGAEEGGEGTEAKSQQDVEGAIPECSEPSLITASCVPSSMIFTREETVDHFGRRSRGGRVQPQSMGSPTIQTVTINTAVPHAYGPHGQIVLQHHPKKLCPFVAGFKSERYRIPRTDH